jgi:hypothetical protein
MSLSITDAPRVVGSMSVVSPVDTTFADGED